MPTVEGGNLTLYGIGVRSGQIMPNAAFRSPRGRNFLRASAQIPNFAIGECLITIHGPIRPDASTRCAGHVNAHILSH